MCLWSWLSWVLGVGELPSNGSFFFGLDACGAVKLFESSKSCGSIGIGKVPSVLSDSQSTASVMVYPFHGSVSYCTVVIHFHSVI